MEVSELARLAWRASRVSQETGPTNPALSKEGPSEQQQKHEQGERAFAAPSMHKAALLRAFLIEHKRETPRLKTMHKTKHDTSHSEQTKRTCVRLRPQATRFAHKCAHTNTHTHTHKRESNSKRERG